MTSIPSLGGRLKLGAGWCNTPSPVLRGAGNESLYGRDIVAPPGNQAATENTNVCLTGDENPAYSPSQLVPDRRMLVVQLVSVFWNLSLAPYPADNLPPATLRVEPSASGVGVSPGLLPVGRTAPSRQHNSPKKYHLLLGAEGVLYPYA
jgi:hypothetical protein